MGVCSGRIVSLFNDKIKINAHQEGIFKLSQKLYNVTCEIQQIRCHVNDLIQNTCPGNSADASVHLFTLRTKIAFLTEALVGSDADTSVTTCWLTFSCKKENTMVFLIFL